MTCYMSSSSIWYLFIWRCRYLYAILTPYYLDILNKRLRLFVRLFNTYYVDYLELNTVSRGHSFPSSNQHMQSVHLFSQTPDSCQCVNVYEFQLWFLY